MATVVRGAAIGLAVWLAGCGIERSGLAARDAREDPITDAGSARDPGAVDAARLQDGGGGLADAGAPDAGPPPLCERDPVGLVVCYAFDGDGTDGAPAALHATASNVQFAEGRERLALETREDSDVQLPHGTPWESLTEMTVEMWIAPAVLPSTERVGLMDKPGSFGVFLHPGGELRCAQASVWVSAPGAVTAGPWRHVACTYDGVDVRLYVGGTLAASEPAPAGVRNNSNPLRIGEDAPHGDQQFLGRIDSVRVWSRALSAEVVAREASR